MEDKENDLNLRVQRLEERIKELRPGSDYGWNSKMERYVIISGLFLLVSCFLIVSYLAIRSEITLSEKLIGIITVLLGYLFGYLPLKASEAGANKKLKELEKEMETSKESIKKLEGTKNIADTGLAAYQEIRSENDQLKEIIKQLRKENEGYKTDLKQLLDID